MREDGYHYNVPGYPQFSRPLPTPEANVPGRGPPSHGYSGPPYPPQGIITHSGIGYEGSTYLHPQASVSYASGHQVRTGYGSTSASVQHPRSPQPASTRNPPHASSFARQQNPGPSAVNRPLSRSSAGVQNGSHIRTSHSPVSFPGSTFPPEWPSPRRSVEHNLTPQMPVPQPFSSCTGKRRALAIGINYTLHHIRGFRLKRAVEDAYSMANFLRENLGFAHDDVRVITDESPWDPATKENILEAMRALVHGAQPHDSFFFYFSGHAYQIKDLNGDEVDGLDECICAMDYLHNEANPTPDTPGLIVDDIMHELMVKPLPLGCRLTAIFDSCHSETLLDLPYIYHLNGMAKEIKHPHKLWMLRQKANYAHVVSLSACKDNQTAIETHRGGALRWAFIDCMKACRNNITYRELVRNIRGYMTEYQFRQKPRLSSSHEIDTNLRFLI